MDAHELAHIGERAFWRAVLQASPPDAGEKVVLPMRPGNDFHRACEAAAQQYLMETGGYSHEEKPRFAYGDPLGEAQSTTDSTILEAKRKVLDDFMWIVDRISKEVWTDGGFGEVRNSLLRMRRELR